ncbi:MAG: hypothetical protein CMN76_02020 [Spirochaetaceae bacterium]|nr:hypothetical protein [Spirochaetaceae bacterium]|tara:strand:+ start:63208 stop:63963 length:756 start_codon:yes stop_codon:yes gene_type:complete
MNSIAEDKETLDLKPDEPGSHKKVFLTAEWKHLINLTYAVDPEILKPHLPAGLELDIWQGSAHVSLVAFDFLKTKVLGLSIPTYRNFPEVNLRFYVRWKNKPAVVFIREFVPKRAISLAANVLYNEPYKRIPMTSSVTADTGAGAIRVNHQFGGQSLAVEATAEKYIPEPNTAEHHFKEHDLGFGVDHGGRTLCYRVEHPVWYVFPLKRVHMNVDFSGLYGEKWSFLNQAAPAYSLLAEGSQIKVRFPFSV